MSWEQPYKIVKVNHWETYRDLQEKVSFHMRRKGWAPHGTPFYIEEGRDRCLAQAMVYIGTPEEKQEAIFPTRTEEGITFSPTLIKEFDQVDNKFVYEVTRNGIEVQLHVTRNDPVKEWRYHPDAY